MSTRAKIGAGVASVLVTLVLLVILSFIAAPASVNAPEPSPGASAAPSPGAAVDTNIHSCLTGAIAETLAEPSPAPVGDQRIFVSGRGDPCSYLSVYVGEAGPPDPNDSSVTTVALVSGLDPAGGTINGDVKGMYAVPESRLSDGGAPTDIAPVPAVAITNLNGTREGGYRFAVTPGYVWRIILRLSATDPPRDLVVPDESGCTVAPASLVIQGGKVNTRLIAHIDLRTRSLSCSATNVITPLGDNQSIIKVGTEDFKRDQPLPDIGTLPRLNPIAVGLRAGAGRIYPATLVAQLRGAEAARASITDPISIFIFLVGAFVVIALGSFAVWVLFRSGSDERKRKPLGGSKPTKLTSKKRRWGIRS